MLSFEIMLIFPAVLVVDAFSVMSLFVASTVSPDESRMSPVVVIPAVGETLPPLIVITPFVVVSTRSAPVPAVVKSSCVSVGIELVTVPLGCTRFTATVTLLTITSFDSLINVELVVPAPGA